MAWPYEEHPWWTRYEPEVDVSATTFNKQTKALLQAHTEHLRESVT